MWPARVVSAGACALVVLSIACSSESGPRDYGTGIEAPTILRDVAMLDDDGAFTHPYVPGVRTTMDGRVGIRVQGALVVDRESPETPLGTHLGFYLLAPERLSGPIVQADPGTEIMGSPVLEVPFPLGMQDGVARVGHHTICDPTQEFPQDGERPNPFPCEDEPGADCYALTLISSITYGEAVFALGTTMYGTPALVKVRDPKTPDATIAEVTLGEPVEGVTLVDSAEWAEPAVTIDGRLLTGRWGRSVRDWEHPGTGEVIAEDWDLAYAVLPEDAEPCDVTGWTDFHPISHAPYDPQMVGRYGLARYPFRDSEGALIPDGADVAGSYPWVDREGDNVFMTAVPGRLADQSEESYPRRCVQEGCEDYEQQVDWDRGYGVAGAWTHGKFVYIDGLLNNVDWAIGVAPQTHFDVELYETRDGAPVDVRLGSGRFIGELRGVGPYPDAYTENPNIIDSIQNLFQAHTHAKTISFRDVVWVMSSGVATDEVSFDDYLDPRAIIVSNMRASITPWKDTDGTMTSFPDHHNGQQRIPFTPRTMLLPLSRLEDAPDEIHLQNAATTLDFEVPAYGLVEAGTGRVEPAALGGIEGKGFWLDGHNAIRYATKATETYGDPDHLSIGLFVDLRADDGASRTLLTFPDGTSITLGDDGRIEYRDGGSRVHRVELEDLTGWHHLAWEVDTRTDEVVLLVDGFARDRVTPGRPLFRLAEGELVVGNPRWETEGDASGFRGWIDELRLLAYAPTVEVACNHARGTIMRVEGDAGAWGAQADAHPDWARARVASALGEDTPGRYVCYHDYSEDHAASFATAPTGLTPLREALTFPEGPLRYGAPRPDSTGNDFCLSCHHESGQGGLSLEALRLEPGLMLEDDPRRQPSQPPRRVFGNIPAGWLPAADGPGSPADAMVTPAEGVLVEAWTLPRAE